MSQCEKESLDNGLDKKLPDSSYAYAMILPNLSTEYFQFK